jgi:hypothetical protein
MGEVNLTMGLAHPSELIIKKFPLIRSYMSCDHEEFLKI